MLTKKIDCFGFNKTGEDYFRREKKAVDVASDGSTYTYIRFSLEDVCPIWRIDSSGGNTSIRWDYGAWSDRDMLSYSHELNQPMEIEA